MNQDVSQDERDDDSVDSLIDRLCDEFEEACKTNQRPRIEAYLQRVAGDQQGGLLEELIGLECFWQRRWGGTPVVEDYLARFPDQVNEVRSTRRRLVGSSQGGRFWLGQAHGKR